MRAIDPPAAKPLEGRAQAFAPLLVVNQVRTEKQRDVGARIVASCRERLGVAIELAGAIDADANVAAAVERRQTVLQAFPLCRFSRQIEALAKHLQRSSADRSSDRGEALVSRGAPRAPRRSGDVAPSRPLPPLDPAEPGGYLRRVPPGAGPEPRGDDRADAGSASWIRSRYERFELLPPEPYLKGYLLEYARALDLPEIAGLANCYLAKAPRSPPESPPALAAKRRVRGWWR